MARSSTGTDRLGRWIAALLALLAAAAITAALVISHNAAERRARLTAAVPPALTSTAFEPTSRPATTATPAATATPATPTAPAAATTAGRTTPRTTSTSSAPRPVPARIVRAIAPRHLFIPQLGVNTTVVAKPTQLRDDPFLGRAVPSFGVPDDMYTTTWWSSGPRPGAPGMAVILGHTQIGGYGVFNHLASLRPREVIGVTSASTTLRFEVMAVRTGISKTDPTALPRTLRNHPAAARLALLTCSGTFDQGSRESAENTVVFARLVAASG